MARKVVEDLLLLGGCLFELGEADRPAALQAVRAELDARIADGLPVGPDGALDPADALNAMIAAGLDGRSAFWRSRYVATGRRLVRALAGQDDETQLDLARLEPRRFDLEVRRTFNLARASGVVRLRLPLPVEDAQLTELALQRDGPAAQASLHPGRLELKVDSATADQVALAVRLSFTARPRSNLAPSDLSPALREQWLRHREGVPLIGGRVSALAATLPTAGDAAQTVRTLRDHLLDSFSCGAVPYEQVGDVPLSWVLEHRWFDCRLGALLLVALCRAKGVPARLVGGYLLWDAPTEHYWMEAWLPGSGWSPFDLLAWDLSAGGRDRAWRDVYLGSVDYRMKTQVFPDVFTGAPGVPISAWRRVSRAIPDGVETLMLSADDGRWLYTDEIRFIR